MQTAAFQRAVLNWFDQYGRTNLPWQHRYQPLQSLGVRNYAAADSGHYSYPLLSALYGELPHCAGTGRGTTGQCAAPLDGPWATMPERAICIKLHSLVSDQ